VPVKKIWKSVNTWRRYGLQQSWTFFLRDSVYTDRWLVTGDWRVVEFEVFAAAASYMWPHQNLAGVWCPVCFKVIIAIALTDLIDLLTCMWHTVLDYLTGRPTAFTAFAQSLVHVCWSLKARCYLGSLNNGQLPTSQMDSLPLLKKRTPLFLQLVPRISVYLRFSILARYLMVSTSVWKVLSLLGAFFLVWMRRENVDFDEMLLMKLSELILPEWLAHAAVCHCDCLVTRVVTKSS